MSEESISPDPSGWSTERLKAHAREWAGLPVFPAKSVVPVMDGDIAELDHLDDAIFAALSFLPSGDLRRFNAGASVASVEQAVRKRLGDWRLLSWPPLTPLEELMAGWPAPVWRDMEAAA